MECVSSYDVVEYKNKNKLNIQKNTFSKEYLINNFFNFIDVSSKTATTYKKALKRVFYYFSEQGINNPKRENIINFKRELESKGRKPSTIALYLAAARRFFSWTESTGIYPNITTGIKAPKLSKGHKKDCFSGSQIKSILSSIDRSTVEGLRNYAVMALMTTGGLRTVEITRANIEDLRNVGGVSVLYIQGKGRSDKTEFIKLTPKVEQAIRAYLKARGQVAINAPLFASESKRNRGQGLTTRTISSIAKAAMIEAGFNSSRLTAHSLRHTAVTLALLAGQELAEVQHFARHNNISTTQIYAHNIDRMKSQCEAAISNAIF